jgi:hypothetical protein
MISGLDVFWLILSVVLVAAVVLVASVAHTSMDKVGPAGTVIEAAPLPRPAPTPAPPIVIVQVASYTSRTIAVASARGLLRHGLDAHVLDSDRYRPLKRGYFVVYVGPYEATAAGRASARRSQQKVPGALVRDIQVR